MTKLRQRDEQLIRACAIANGDPDILSMERDWDTLPDEIPEPWTDAPAR